MVGPCGVELTRRAPDRARLVCMQDGVSIDSLGHGKETTLGSVTRSELRGDSAASPAAGRWLHLSSLAMETFGAVIFYWQGLPMYREISADPSAYASHNTPRLWWLLGIVLIQVGYWVRYRTAPVLPQVSNTALRHMVLFLGQMVFTLPTAVFSFVFISRKLSSEVPVIGYVLTLAGLFSMFLYMRELQWLGNSLALREKKPGESPS